MRSRRAYKRVKVNDLDRKNLALVAKKEKAGVLGLDIAKEEIVACLRWDSGEFERPWSISNPFGIKEFVELCQSLASEGLKLTVSMESTGTYGESVRNACTLAGIQVQRVSGKHVSDYQEIFDGVPSQHDGKDAAMIAELCSLGKGVAWPFESPSESMEEIGLQVRRMDTFHREQVQWLGRLEAEVTRFWPELTRYVKFKNVTTLKLLAEYGSPAEALKDVEVRRKLRRWGGAFLSDAKIENIIQSAGTTVGVPMSRQNIVWVKEICTRALTARQAVKKCGRNLREILEKDTFFSKYREDIGAATIGVILASVGDPRSYGSAGALLKGLGLNLKERSSGKRIGEKAITKRGPSLARRWLYFWALRAVQRDELSKWYDRFQNVNGGHADRPTKHRKMKGIICMMRKLIRSLWSAMHEGVRFDYSKVIGAHAKAKRKRRRISTAGTKTKTIIDSSSDVLEEPSNGASTKTTSTNSPLKRRKRIESIKA